MRARRQLPVRQLVQARLLLEQRLLEPAPQQLALPRRARELLLVVPLRLEIP
jgi:hypothetical protein